MAVKKKQKAKVSSTGKPYDSPKEGFKRWTTYIEPESLDKVKNLAIHLGKTSYEVVNEAIKEYVRKHIGR